MMISNLQVCSCLAESCVLTASLLVNRFSSQEAMGLHKKIKSSGMLVPIQEKSSRRKGLHLARCFFGAGIVVDVYLLPVMRN